MSGDGPRAGLQMAILLYLHLVERENKLGLSSSCQNIHPGTSLVVQWLRLHAPNAGAPGSIPSQGPRSHMPQLKIPCAATKTWHSQVKKYFFKKHVFPEGLLGLRNQMRCWGYTGDRRA